MVDDEPELAPFREPSLVAILRARSRRERGEIALRFLKDGDADEVLVTYGELDERARAAAAWLQERSAPGERALLLYPPGLDFVVGFLGSLYAGVVGVPAYPPRTHRPDPRIQDILTDAGARVALTTGAVLSGLERARSQSPGFASLDWCATDGMDSARAADWHECQPGASTLAYLQYTSGSTRAPKGVMVTHGNLLANLEDFERGLRHEAGSVFVSWLPHFHDMGLVYGILQPLAMGFPAVLMPPAAFMQSPVRWLRAFTRYRGTHTAAPNFAYDACVEKVTEEQKRELDLRRWVCAINGAEPVRADTLARFASAFRSCGFEEKVFCPGFGLAESTLKVSAERRGEGPYLLSLKTADLERKRVVPASPEDLSLRTLVGCGRAEPGTEIRIVDPESLEPCPKAGVGEIWVASASVARGYWNRPEESASTFEARLSDGSPGCYLRTGDLGFLWPPDRGELFVTGRIKDLIIVRGRNHYPHDIELTAESSHPALLAGCGAAFSIEVEGSERLAIAQEIHRHRAGEAAEVIEAIRRAVAEEHEVSPAVVILVKQGRVPKTSSGKIQRQACARAFREGTLESVTVFREEELEETAPSFRPASSRLSREEIETFLCASLSRHLRCNPDTIDAQKPFQESGLDSAGALTWTGEIETWLGRTLSPTLFWNYPTIADLARYLDPEAANDGS
jgi:acyl-CoA synthetase (AMP-forming)/AMP-acid ligase II/acyl carrier protein